MHFVTGSAHVPAVGFKFLTGYGGRVHRFRLQRMDCPNGGADGWLPTASTCFNTLYLPRYSSIYIQRSRLVQAIAEGSGFDEDAVGQ